VCCLAIAQNLLREVFFYGSKEIGNVFFLGLRKWIPEKIYQRKEMTSKFFLKVEKWA